jgi:hypothetical protein
MSSLKLKSVRALELDNGSDPAEYPEGYYLDDDGDLIAITPDGGVLLLGTCYPDAVSEVCPPLTPLDLDVSYTPAQE